MKLRSGKTSQPRNGGHKVTSEGAGKTGISPSSAKATRATGGQRASTSGADHSLLPHYVLACPDLIEGARKHYDLCTTDQHAKDLMAKLKVGQQPKIFCVSCSDSRVSVPKVFNLKAGEVFEHCNMGNLLPRLDANGPEDASLLATIEYAISILKVEFLMVLGHTGCGLVKATMDRARAGGKMQLPASIGTWADHAGHLKEQVDQHFRGLSGEQADLAAVGENVLRQLDRLRSLPVVREALASGKVKGIAGAVYELTNHGVVSWWNDDLQRFVATKGTTSIPERQVD